MMTLAARKVGGVRYGAIGVAWLFGFAGLIIAITSGTVPATFSTSSDFNRFAAFYVVAQAIERLVEVFSPLVPPWGDDPARKNSRALVFGAVTFVIGVAIARWTGLLFLQAIGWTSPSSWLDVIVTGLVLSGGTKALHDLISNISKP
jgi:hypothetical protein